MSLSANDLHALRLLATGQVNKKLKRLERFEPRYGQSPEDTEVGRRKIMDSLAFYAGLEHRTREAETRLREAAT